MSSHVFTGTAAGHKDLYDKIISHLTDGASLGSEVWELLQQTTPSADVFHSFLRAPGLSDSDDIFVNLGAYKNVGADYYNMLMQGAIAFNPLLTMQNQPGFSPISHITLWQGSMPYWLIVNGRRFMLVAKISTVYVTAYAGFILPYSTSAEMPYPLYIAGNTPSPRRWSDDSFGVGSFFDPPSGSASIRHFDGTWLSVENYQSGVTYRSEFGANIVWPWHSDYQIGNNRNLEYALLPGIVHSNYSGNNVYGELQGAYFCSGFANASENTITVAGKTYLVIQSTNRTSRRDYAALLLE